MTLRKIKYRRTDIKLKNRRGYTIECSYFQTQNVPTPAPCVIFLHANGCSRLEAMDYLEFIGPSGMNLFCFDFSGSGMSEGPYCSLGWFEQDDLECAIDYLTNTGKASHIAVWGRSMGAITALLYARRDPRINCLVLDSPFTSFKQFAKDYGKRRASLPGFVTLAAVAIVRSSILSRANFDLDALDLMKEAPLTKIPAVFAAADGDTFVLPSHSTQLYEAYGGAKKKHIIFYGDHNSPRPPVFLKQVLEFIKQHLNEPIEKKISVQMEKPEGIKTPKAMVHPTKRPQKPREAETEENEALSKESAAGSKVQGDNEELNKIEKIMRAHQRRAHNKEFLLIKYKDGKFLCLMRYLTHIAL